MSSTGKSAKSVSAVVDNGLRSERRFSDTFADCINSLRDVNLMRRNSMSTSSSSCEGSDNEWTANPINQKAHDDNRGQAYRSIRSQTPSPPPAQAPTPLLPPPNQSKKHYPNCDAFVWLRSCEHEIIEPISGTTKGVIPYWLKGSLLRNGPGSLKVADMKFKHLFDSSALLHRFCIDNGSVTYQCRFIQTETYKKNAAANRIVVTEFGTTSVPDPCHTIFQRISSVFKPGDTSDNTMISIYPFGDEFFALTEYPIIHSININTLATQRKVNISDYTGIINHSSHPHIMANGTVYNLGMTVTKTGPCYNILCFPSGDSMFDDAHIVATLPSRWKFHPSYMHTFGLTEHYFVIVEQPLSLSVAEIIKCQLRNKPMATNFKWFGDQTTCIYLICRSTGALKHTFETDAIFYLHIINAYEEDQHVIVDICCYKDPGMLDCMYVAAMENMQTNPDYAAMFRGKPMRFVLSLRRSEMRHREQIARSFSITNLFAKLNLAGPMLKRSFSEHQGIKYSAIGDGKSEMPEHLSKIESDKAQAITMAGSRVYCKPEILCDLGCETPRIFYESYMGKKYRYFYAISSDVDAENPGTLIKVDVENKTRKTWCEPNCYPSEPIFVPNPYAETEDDGIILAAMVWGGTDENRVGLLILCASTWTEMGRCEFITPGPVPKCLHGWFAAA